MCCAAPLTDGRRGITEHLQTLLVMGNDDAEGTLVPEGDGVRVDWPDVGTSRYYEHANQVVGDAASVDGGTFCTIRCGPGCCATA